jgi:DNA-binding transcriptional MocR family regulator
MEPMANTEAPLYLQVARLIEDQIRSGVLRVGDRIPSLRALSRKQQVSVTTTLQAYFWLENRGYLEARNKSGFYVRIPAEGLAPEPKFQASESAPSAVDLSEILMKVARAVGDRGKVPLGAACPSPVLLPYHKLNRITRAIVQKEPLHSSYYLMPEGWELLRRQVARRSLDFGCAFTSSDVVITCGALEALNLCLRAVAKPGDLVAIESPTYFGVLQAIESLGMRALEIPTHPRTGMNLDVLDRSIVKHRVKACIAMTNCHNPLGYILEDDRKKALVEVLARHQVPLIEDDLYGDLSFAFERPRTAKAFDRHGLVLLCSSFSKALAPGYRVGWVEAGRYRNEVVRLKSISNISTPTLPQMVVAKFLESGGYDRYLRRLRQAFSDQVQAMTSAITRYFPAGTRLTRPAGGYILWVELPKAVNAVKLFRQALAENISITPGPNFSASGKFQSHIRINCGNPWSDQIDRALLTLAKLCQKQISSRG